MYVFLALPGLLDEAADLTGLSNGLFERSIVVFESLLT
jgi:hypothetical protein